MSAAIWRNNRSYVNDVDYFGKIEEASVEIKRKMNEVGGMGQPAKMDVPTGQFEKMTAKVKFNNISPTDIRAVSGNGGFIALRMLGDVQLPDVVSGLIDDDSMQTRLTGWVTEIPVPKSNQDHKTDIEISISVAMVEVSNKDGVIMLIDNINGVVEPRSL